MQFEEQTHDRHTKRGMIQYITIAPWYYEDDNINRNPACLGSPSRAPKTTHDEESLVERRKHTKAVLEGNNYKLGRASRPQIPPGSQVRETHIFIPTYQGRYRHPRQASLVSPRVCFESADQPTLEPVRYRTRTSL